MKKKITLLKVFMTLCLLLVGIGNAWGETKTLTFNLTSNPGSWPTTNSTTLTNYTYTLDEVDYTFGLKNVKCNSGYLMLTSTAVLGLPAIEGYKLTKVVAKNSGGCSTSTKVGVSSSSSTASYISGGAIQTWSTTSSSYTYNLSGTSNNTVYYLYVTNKNAQITELALTYEGQSAPVAVEAPTFTPAEAEFLESTSVSLACATEGASIYYTLDGTDPTNASTPYTEAINISETTTIKAIAYKGDDASSVATKTYTKIVPLTTMDAIFNASATTGDYWITFNNWVVSGVKGSNAYITDNAGKGLIVYYKSGHGFEVGDKLSGTVKCALTRYNGSAEITDLTSTTEGLAVTKDGTLNTIDATIANLGGVNTGAYINLGALTYNGTEFTDGTNTIKPYNTFITLPTLTNGKKYYVKGVYIQFNDTKEIAPLDATDFAEVPATEYNITITPCENGSVTVDAEENKAQEGQVVTLTITPNAHYALSTLSVTDASLNPITVTDDYKFTMPASDVRVNATFAEIPTHAAKFFVNGVQYGETQLVLEGGEVEFPEEDPAAIGTRSFVGWTASPMSGVSDEAPKFEKSATMGTEDLNFYAVFAKKQEGDGNYEKVTSAPADWCGEYLLVYESSETVGVAWTGVDAGKCHVDVSISNGEISKKPETAVTLTIATMDGGHSIKVNGGTNNGKYINQTTYSNGLAFFESPSANTLSHDNTSTVIAGSGFSDGSHVTMRYNSSTGDYNERFRYYKSGQQAIQLYKKQEATYSNYCTTVTVPATITNTSYATFSCDYALDLDELPEGLKAYYATYTTGASTILMKEAEGKVPANTGLFLKGTESTSYNILIAATGTTIDDNILEPTDGTELPIGTYVYMKADGKFHPLGSALVVSKGKAYIPAVKIDGEQPVGISFEGELTGINSVYENVYENENLYNLQGIRVTTPKKGEVYIMNGKKFLMK